MDFFYQTRDSSLNRLLHPSAACHTTCSTPTSPATFSAVFGAMRSKPRASMPMDWRVESKAEPRYLRIRSNKSKDRSIFFTVSKSFQTAFNLFCYPLAFVVTSPSHPQLPVTSTGAATFNCWRSSPRPPESRSIVLAVHLSLKCVANRRWALILGYL